ncbi:hypothetical protein B0H14DRAFT_2581620 [Mycena olivaceomarginata]|nr:hypothetical protein B0H14DRAFT_2581620 [Mycena olivaceomarginata]
MPPFWFNFVQLLSAIGASGVTTVCWYAYGREGTRNGFVGYWLPDSKVQGFLNLGYSMPRSKAGDRDQTVTKLLSPPLTWTIVLQHPRLWIPNNPLDRSRCVQAAKRPSLTLTRFSTSNGRNSCASVVIDTHSLWLRIPCGHTSKAKLRAKDVRPFYIPHILEHSQRIRKLGLKARRRARRCCTSTHTRRLGRQLETVLKAVVGKEGGRTNMSSRRSVQCPVTAE